MIDLTPRKESLKRRILRSLMRLMVRWHMISLVDGKLVYPSLPLTGKSLWAYRAWMYLPMPVGLLLLFTKAKFVGTPLDFWVMVCLLSAAALALVFLSYRYDRRNPLRMPSFGEACGYLLWCSLIGIFQVVIHVIMDRRFELKSLTVLLVLPVLALVTLPLSLVIIDEQKRNKAKRDRVKA